MSRRGGTSNKIACMGIDTMLLQYNMYIKEYSPIFPLKNYDNITYYIIDYIKIFTYFGLLSKMSNLYMGIGGSTHQLESQWISTKCGNFVGKNGLVLTEIWVLCSSWTKLFLTVMSEFAQDFVMGASFFMIMTQ